jgi:hypothetical protein
MKFECYVDINAPREKVIELFDSFDNLKEWQDGYQGHEAVEGTPGEVGAKTKLTYHMRGRPMELIETITKRDFPHEFSGTYDHKHMTNSMQNLFEEIEGGTRWRAKVHYTTFSGFMANSMAFLFPSMFKKQVQKWMDQFKEFAERN